MRVVITGMGIVSPIGNDLETYWNSLVSGCSGITMLHDRYPDQLKCHFAGQVFDLNTEAFFSKKQLRRMDRFCQIATIAAKNAWHDSTGDLNKNFQKNTGVIFGTGIGGISTWDILGILSKENTKTAVKPFDKNRTGFVLAEGAAAIVLESLDSAGLHNKKIYGEIIGFGSNCDAHHLTSPAKDGQAKAIQLALNDAGITPEKIDYINAHGTATRLNDSVETDAIKKVFGNYAYNIPVSATKSMLGHAMGASSAMEFVATILSVKNDLIHPTVNYQTLDPECDLDYVPEKARAKTITHAISNSFGFGGSNAVLVMKKWKN